MNCLENSDLLSALQSSVGGIAYVPPTYCPLPAYTPANVAAYVKRTGMARMSKTQSTWLVRRPVGNFPVLEMS